MHLGEPVGQQPVLGHGVEDPGLAHEHDQDDGAQARDGAQLDDGPQPEQPRAGGVHAHGHGIRHQELVVLDDAGQDQGHEDVEHRADRQGTQDADGHVLLRVLRLLGRGGDRVEADVGEEDDPGPAQDAAPAVMAEMAVVGRDEGHPILGMDVLDAEGDEEQDHADLGDDDDVVEVGGFLDADDQQSGDDRDDERRPGS